jgi:hypothetical protein
LIGTHSNLAKRYTRYLPRVRGGLRLISRPREATTSSLLYLKAKNNSLASKKNVHCKKSLPFSRPQPGYHLTNSAWSGKIKLFPARESLVRDIPARDGNMANLYFTV